MGKKKIKGEKRLGLSLLLIALLLITSCAATTLTSVWKDESYTGNLKKVFVIGASQNTQIRSAFENEFINQLNSHGVDAFPSHYIIYPEKMLDKDTIVSNIKNLDIDAVLITSLSNKNTMTYQGWYESYTYNYRVSKRASAETDATFYLETKLFDAKTEKLIWSATS
jgi:hypothetical protein